MGSFPSDLALPPTPKRIARARRRQRRRRLRRVLYFVRHVLYLVVGIALLGFLLFHGVGPYYLNLSPGTDSGGSVSIQTDHAQYRDTEAMRVTVTNHLHVPIYTVYFPEPECGIYLVAQAFGAGQWQRVYGSGGSCAYPPPLGCQGTILSGPTPIVPPKTVLQIKPGTAYVETWRPYHDFDHVWWEDGPSRIVFVYTTDSQAIQTIVTLLTSQQDPYVPRGVPEASSDVQVATSATLQITPGGTLGQAPECY